MQPCHISENSARILNRKVFIVSTRIVFRDLVTRFLLHPQNTILSYKTKTIVTYKLVDDKQKKYIYAKNTYMQKPSMIIFLVKQNFRRFPFPANAVAAPSPFITLTLPSAHAPATASAEL